MPVIPTSQNDNSGLRSRCGSRGTGRARHLVLTVVAVLLLGPFTSAADEPRGGYVLVPAARVGPRPVFGVGGRAVLFLNGQGGHYAQGWQDDASQNVSSILGFEVDIPAYPYGDESWAQVVSCMREMYADFDIEVTDVDPGDAPHMEAVIGGPPSALGLADGYGGVAPLACGIIPNAVSFTFPETYGDNPAGICEAAAQESAHAIGLDHGYLCEDVMTYLVDCGRKRFVDQDVSCGEFSERPCACGGDTQNSYQYLLDVLGPARPDAPPIVEITEPADGAAVERAFEVVVAATDDLAIDRVELYVDGALVEADEQAPWSFGTPADLGAGAHEIEVRALDGTGQSASDRITIELDEPPGDDDDDDDALDPDDEDDLVDPDDDGSLADFGERCDEGDDCLSNACARSGHDDERFCTEACESGSCPDGTVCTSVDVGDYCLPEGRAGATVGLSAGGCTTSRGSPDGLAVVFFALVLTLLRRRHLLAKGTRD